MIAVLQGDDVEKQTDVKLEFTADLPIAGQTNLCAAFRKLGLHARPEPGGDRAGLRREHHGPLRRHREGCSQVC